MIRDFLSQPAGYLIPYGLIWLGVAGLAYLVSLRISEVTCERQDTERLIADTAAAVHNLRNKLLACVCGFGSNGQNVIVVTTLPNGNTKSDTYSLEAWNSKGLNADLSSYRFVKDRGAQWRFSPDQEPVEIIWSEDLDQFEFVSKSDT